MYKQFIEIDLYTLHCILCSAWMNFCMFILVGIYLCEANSLMWGRGCAETLTFREKCRDVDRHTHIFCDSHTVSVKGGLSEWVSARGCVRVAQQRSTCLLVVCELRPGLERRQRHPSFPGQFGIPNVTAPACSLSQADKGEWARMSSGRS